MNVRYAAPLALMYHPSINVLCNAELVLYDEAMLALLCEKD